MARQAFLFKLKPNESALLQQATNLDACVGRDQRFRAMTSESEYDKESSAEG